MSRRFSRLIAGTLFEVFSIRVAFSQTPVAPNKNCVLPHRTYQPSARVPPHVKHSGVATMSVFVDEKSRVTDVKILNSWGNDKYDSDALAAVKKWKFKPSLCNGKPAPAHIAVEMQSHAN